jgi:hypothetical protein
MLDETPCGSLVEDHGTLLRFGFQRLHLIEVLSHTRDFPENGVLLCVHSPKF